MNQRDRLMAVFEGKPLDHLPWLADLSYWHFAAEKRGTLPLPYQGHEGYLRLHRELGVCIYYGMGLSPALLQREGVKEESIEEGDRAVDRIECDGQVLEQHRRWLPESCCWAITRHYVTEVSQLAVVREIYRRTRYLPNPDADAPLRDVGEDGLPILPLPRSPLPALFVDWVGVEGTVFLMADAREEVEETLAVIDRANDGFFSLLSRTSAHLCHFCDNLSAETIGGYWDAYCADYYRRRVAQVHAAGKYCVTHLDGATRGLIRRLVDAGLDGIESLTPKPVGDITMEEMSQLMEPSDCVFWGGLPGAMFVPPWDWDSLREMVGRLHRLHHSGRRVVVGSADQVPPDAHLDDVRRIAERLAQLGA